jgi:hypothetical protein
VQGATKAARGFHHAAGELEAIHQQRIGAGILPEGVAFDEAHLQLVGRMAGAVVLEAIAIELVLKARMKRARISFDSLRDKHDHSALYSLPDLEKQEAEQQYQCIRHPSFRATTLAEALSFSAKVFVKFRYMHEEPSVEASLGEMQRTFNALAEGI